MEFSPLQCTGKVGDKVGDKVRGLCRGHKSQKSATQIMKVGDVICVADFHDLCPRHVRDFVGNLSRTLSQSRRNGIWALFRPEAIACEADLSFAGVFSPSRNLRAPWADCREILHDASMYVRFYNPGPKFWGTLPKKFLGEKTCKIWPDFGRLQSSAAKG